MLRAQIPSSPIKRANSSFRDLEESELASTSVVSTKSLILSEERRIINELTNKQLKKEVRSTKVVLQNIISELLAANEKVITNFHLSSLQISNKDKQLNKYRDAFRKGSYFLKSEAISYEIEEYKSIIRLQEEQIEEQSHHIRYLEDLLAGLSRQVSQVYQKVLQCVDADWDISSTATLLEPFQESISPSSPLQSTRSGKNTPNGNSSNSKEAANLEKVWKALVLSRQENMETKEMMEQLVLASKKVSQRAVSAEERVAVLEQQLQQANFKLEKSLQEHASMADSMNKTIQSHKQRIHELEEEKLFSQTHNEKRELAKAKEQLHYLELDNQHLQQELEKARQNQTQNTTRVNLLQQNVSLLQKELQAKELMLESSETKLQALKELSEEGISLGPISPKQQPAKQPEPEQPKPVQQPQKVSPKPVTFKVDYDPFPSSPTPILKRADSGPISRKGVSFGEPEVYKFKPERSVQIQEPPQEEDDNEQDDDLEEEEEVEAPQEHVEPEPQEVQIEVQDEELEMVEEEEVQEEVYEEYSEEIQEEPMEDVDVEAIDIPIEPESDEIQDTNSPPVTP